jgi:hypothetical protein
MALLSGATSVDALGATVHINDAIGPQHGEWVYPTVIKATLMDARKQGKVL